MPQIENCSLSDVRSGDHSDFGPNTVLIQITDPAYEPPIPARDFATVFQFEFLDIDQSDIDKHDEDAGFAEFACTLEQAQRLVDILKHALEQDQSVIVHCHAGVCRSGAVVEVAEIMGFTPTPRFRSPNLLVKHLMMSVLGLTYDSDEVPYTRHMCGREEKTPVGGTWCI